MLLLNCFALFQKLPSVLGVLLLTLICKIMEVRSLGNDVWMFFESIDYDVKQPYCATCVISILFHVEEIFWYRLNIKSI